MAATHSIEDIAREKARAIASQPQLDDLAKDGLVCRAT